jgi:hypothetical protein
MSDFEQRACGKREQYDLQQDQTNKLKQQQPRPEVTKAELERRKRKLEVATALQPRIAAAVRKAAREIAPYLPVETANINLSRPEQPKSVLERNYGVRRVLLGKQSRRTRYESVKPEPGWILGRHVALPRNMGLEVILGSFADHPTYVIDESGLSVSKSGNVLGYEIGYQTEDPFLGAGGYYQRLKKPPVGQREVSQHWPATDAEIAPVGSIVPETNAQGVLVDIARWHSVLLSLIPGSSGQTLRLDG